MITRNVGLLSGSQSLAVSSQDLDPTSAGLGQAQQRVLLLATTSRPRTQRLQDWGHLRHHLPLFRQVGHHKAQPQVPLVLHLAPHQVRLQVHLKGSTNSSMDTTTKDLVATTVPQWVQTTDRRQ